MPTKRLLVKLLILGALAFGILNLPPEEVSAQKGDSCHSTCVTTDDGWPGCASWDSQTGSTCGMTIYNGHNVCMVWQCLGDNN